MFHRELTQDHSYSSMLEQTDLDYREMNDEVLQHLFKENEFILSNKHILLPLSTKPSKEGHEGVYPDLSKYSVWTTIAKTKQIIRVGGSHFDPKMLMKISQALGSALDELSFVKGVTDQNLSGESILYFPRKKKTNAKPTYDIAIHGFSFGEDKEKYAKKNRLDLVCLIKFILVSAALEKELKAELEEEWEDAWNNIRLHISDNAEILNELITQNYPPEMLAALDDSVSIDAPDRYILNRIFRLAINGVDPENENPQEWTEEEIAAIKPINTIVNPEQWEPPHTKEFWTQISAQEIAPVITQQVIKICEQSTKAREMVADIVLKMTFGMHMLPEGEEFQEILEENSTYSQDRIEEVLGFDMGFGGGGRGCPLSSVAIKRLDEHLYHDLTVCRDSYLDKLKTNVKKLTQEEKDLIWYSLWLQADVNDKTTQVIIMTNIGLNPPQMR